jgi:hypothetical protein
MSDDDLSRPSDFSPFFEGSPEEYESICRIMSGEGTTQESEIESLLIHGEKFSLLEKMTNDDLITLKPRFLISQYGVKMLEWSEVLLDQLEKLKDEPHARDYLKGIRREDLRKFGSEILQDMKSATVEIKRYPSVKKLPINKIDPSVVKDGYEYFRVGTGMNINVPTGKITDITFFISILGDARESEDAYIIDGFPNNQIKKIQVLKGEVEIGLNHLLQFIPILGQTVEVKLEALLFNLSFDKSLVRFSGGDNHKVNWHLPGNQSLQDFNCYFTLAKHKQIKKVIALVYAKWTYLPPIASNARTLLKSLIGDRPSENMSKPGVLKLLPRKSMPKQVI